MKRTIRTLLAGLLMLSMLPLGCTKDAPPAMEVQPSPAPTAPAVEMREADGAVVFTRGNLSAAVDAETGFLTKAETAGDSLAFGRVCVDLGIDGAALLNQLGYIDMGGLATYELPTLYPRMKPIREADAADVAPTEDGFCCTLTYGALSVAYRYTMLENALRLDVTLSVSDELVHTVNGVGFLAQGVEGFSLATATFEFPGSTPAGRLAYRTRMRYRADAADYSAPVVQLYDEGAKAANILFVDEIEKWTTASWSDENQRPCVGFLAACEGYLTKDRPMEVGSLYLPLNPTGQDPYEAVSAFWTQLGYHVPQDTHATEHLAAIYSAHPYGTMDTGYFNRLTLAEYAERIGAVADMGFDAVWLLPVFKHTGDNVYEPIDQGEIDPRYGGIGEAKTFIDAAHARNLKVLFDFVPHGPRKVYPLAIQSSCSLANG